MLQLPVVKKGPKEYLVNIILNVEPEEALVLEDSEAGIQAASEAKISVICIPDMKFPQEKYLKKVEHVYDSLEDVISYLEMKKDISK